MGVDAVIELLVTALDSVSVVDAYAHAGETEAREWARVSAGSSQRHASEASLDLTCLHEAAHAVIAIRLDKPVASITLRRDGSGETRFDPSPAAADPFITAAVCLAGPIGSLCAGDDRTCEQLAGSSDVLKAKIALGKCEIDPELVVRSTVAMVLEHWSKIERVARALRERRELRDMQVVLAMLGAR